MESLDAGPLISAAEKFALDNDRMRYRPYFETAEKFCSAHGIIIGGRAGIDLLLGRPLSKDSFMWDLYCANAFNQAKLLVEELHATKNNHVDGRTFTLQTNIKYREFTISVDARFLFKVYILDKYRDVILEDVMDPTVVKGWFGSNVKVFPSSMVLIGLYQTLYSPAKCKQWEDVYQLEKVVYAGESSQPRTGGGHFDRAVADDILLRTLLKDARTVLVGDFAASKLGIGSASRIQILTNIPIEELSAMTSRVLSAEKNQLRRVKVSHERTVYIRYNVNIPSDFQITKHTIYAVVGGTQIALYDAYNSPEYEMIPFTTVDKIQIGTPYVLLRFIFIDIWVIKLIAGLGRRGGSDDNGTDSTNNGDNGDSTDSGMSKVGSAPDLTSRISTLMALAGSIREFIEVGLQNRPFTIFATDYIGVNTSEAVAKKKLIANIGYRLPNYYPALNTGE